jgi:hypothetical protein
MKKFEERVGPSHLLPQVQWINEQWAWVIWSKATFSPIVLAVNCCGSIRCKGWHPSMLRKIHSLYVEY